MGELAKITRLWVDTEWVYRTVDDFRPLNVYVLNSQRMWMSYEEALTLSIL